MFPSNLVNVISGAVHGCLFLSDVQLLARFPRKSSEDVGSSQISTKMYASSFLYMEEEKRRESR
jgi:hypothetical protein